FTQPVYEASIKENSPPRTYVETPAKTGIQLSLPHWELDYSVVSGDDDDLFQAEALKVGDFCFLRVRTRSGNAALLNREVRDAYTLTVEATEKSSDLRAKTKVLVRVLDANDLKPLFYPASYSVSIAEDAELRSSVVTVSATDADVGSNADFYYSFTSRAHPFAVDPFTGTVSLVRKLNHTRSQRYELTVLAEDRTKKISGVQKFGNVAKITVHVQKTSKASPVISQVSKPVVSADGKVTVDVQVEAGVKPVGSLSVVGGDLCGCFTVIPSGAQGDRFQVISTKRIDWPQAPSGFNLSLQARDTSFPSLSSSVQQVHIAAAQISPLAFKESTYRVTLSEFSPPNTHVLLVSLSSEAHNASFSIKDDPDGAPFRINPLTGVIVTTQKLDYESKRRYQFDVAANGGEAEARVVIEVKDENDNSPQFASPSYEASLDENAPVGSSVLQVSATDADGGKNAFVTYALANSGPSPFTIHPFTGVISTSGHLDYELMRRRYHLRVWASDSGSPFSRVSECPVTITLNNVNDNIPLLERVGCNTTLPVDAPVGGTVVQLSAIDPDELQQLRYLIQSGNELQVFAVDSVSGVISLKRAIPPSEGSFTLSVAATDGRHQSEAAVVRVTVTHRGEEATVACQETGISKQLTARLIQSMEPFLAQEEDEAFPDVHVTNRHSPKFDPVLPSSVELSEDFPLNSSVVRLRATDADSGFGSLLVYAISAGNQDGCFSIDTFAGDLRLVCSLDRERNAFYVLNITVYDLGMPQKTAWRFVAVTVTDVNDNPPEFDQLRYVTRVPENAEVDSVVFTAHAADPDLDVGGRLRFSLLTPTNAFSIDPVTGEVTLKAPLDRETTPRHDLQIVAKDGAERGPRLVSVVDLVVVLQDVNDNPPRFLPHNYKIKVPEDLPVGTLLLWVESVDLDLASGGLVTYNLKNPEGGSFRLDSSTGALTLERELDFERRRSYTLTVRAVDHGLPRSLSSSCFVEIEVLDVNENLHRPLFSEFVYEAAVMEDAAVGTSVLKLTASDKDVGRDGEFRFHIQDGSGLGVFSIDEETGVICSAKILDREKMPHYWLSVLVGDLGTEPLLSWTHVFLRVLDVNDNAPQLSQPVYFASVQENVDGVGSVAQVWATDADASSEGKLSFHMLESHRTHFDVDPKTGVVSTLSALDREEKEEHSVEVVVSDNGSPSLSSTTTVVIRVLDDNDNQPKFTDKLFHIKIPEQRRSAGEQEVYRMVARDDDRGSNAAVTYRLQDDHSERFKIDPLLGVVTARGDFWPGNYSILTVKATDQGSPPRSSTARLDVEWIALPPPSDEPISFEEPHFTFAVMETEPVTHMVGIIMTETYGQMWYSITAATSLQVALLASAPPAPPPLSSGLLGLLSTHLLEEDPHSGDEEKDFYIQRNTGTISIARRLDAARRSVYNMTVRVTDGHQVATTQEQVVGFSSGLLSSLGQNHTSPDPLASRAPAGRPLSQTLCVPQAYIRVLDMNEHRPVFSKSLYEVSWFSRPAGSSVCSQTIESKMFSPLFILLLKVRVPEDTSPWKDILQVSAQDADASSKLVFSIHNRQDQDSSTLFHLDPKSGVLVLKEELDYETTAVHTLILMVAPAFELGRTFPSGNPPVRAGPPLSLAPPQVRDQEIPVKRNFAKVVVYVEDCNDHAPTFLRRRYEANVSSQVPAAPRWSRLEVSASTVGGASSSTFVSIYVTDENDNAPVFRQKEYLGQISEAADIGAMVTGEGSRPLVIQASDADRDANALLVYQILEPELLSVFSIDPSMGTISLLSAVDFEARAEYRFSVQVRDSGEPCRYAAEPAKVTVRVLDLNDCAPHFTSPVYESSVILPAVRGMEVTHVTARDADSAVAYSIVEGNLHGAFSVEPSSGLITVSNATGFTGFYQLVLRASDGLHQDLATVRVNGSALTGGHLGFEQDVYTVSVAENLRTVRTLAALKARGCLFNEPLVFSLLNPEGKFSISASSGVLETTGIPFDREETDVYEVVVMVRDTRTPPRTARAQVRVFIDDVNDSPPQFSNLPFSIVIPESSEPGDVLYQASAVDGDLGENASILYSLEEDYSLFRIDPHAGDISLQRPLDFEALNKYVLTVLAVDEGEPSHSATAQLSLQVRNQSSPVFQTLLYPLKVPENIPPFTTILHVQARNPDGYRLVYNLQEENASKHFHIDFKTGVLTVTDPLDYESQRAHVLTVRASDSVTGVFSEASVEIEVEDVNDNAPVFSQRAYGAVVAEGLPVGTSVVQVSASDGDSGRNRDLTFHMLRTERNETEFFDIDPHTGVIVTKQVLDHEGTNQFHLKIRATDNGTAPLSSEASVLVNVTDVNDNPPDFVSSQYEATLDEKAKCGHIVIKIQASDPDSGDLNKLQYKILSGNEGRYFNINQSSGIVSFSNVCRRNLEPFYNLTVAVSDGVFQKTARVNIDMLSTNKHSPSFKQSVYEAELAENAEVGTQVIRLAAIDPDEGLYGSVDYTIINKLADEKLAIDSDGQMVTTQPLDRENPAQRIIAVKVMAKDGGGKVAFCTVRIILTDENDNVPQFAASEYQVSIQSTVNKGSPVVHIMAYDADEGRNADVTYTVDEAEEATEDVIEINPFTGLVTVKDSLVGMENRIFNFKVQARDGSLPFYNATVPVQVRVLPPEVPLPQFSEPLYTFSAVEDAPVGTEIGSVRAASNTPLIYSLVDGNTLENNKDKVFSLDEDSGTLVLQKPMDHERTKWYQIDVMAQGNHNGTAVASLVSISIQVQDVNDNEPLFDASPYRAFLAENMPAGTTVIQVTANDADSETNGLVTYSLEALPEEEEEEAGATEMFSIDEESGWITTTQEADCEAVRVYRFSVVATDNGGGLRLSSSVLVEVTVTDENDNPPKFSLEAYRGSVVENSSPGEVLVSMTTADADVSLENRLVTCYITDGDPLGHFAIIQQSEGGWGLILTQPLDREVKDRHALRVMATDGKFQASVSVDVHVLDINDNSPQCEQLVYTEAVMENSPSSRFVLKVSAVDPDVGANGQVSYSLHGPNADKFHLNYRTGELLTLAVLDREAEPEYNLVAKATDGGGRSCQSDILLMIQDMNDNPPRFSSSHYQLTVFDNTTVHTPIAVLYAKDPDTCSFFSLDEFSGLLRLERPLTPDAPPTFELKVKATDRGLPRHLYSIATVTVAVVSLDDYQPVFLSSEYTAQLPESFAVGSQVLSLSALTRDGGGPDPVAYRIVSGNEDGRFLLDSRTGLLTLVAPLDFEASRTYYLSVEGRRGKQTLSDITTVMVNVTDVNDNAPVFEEGGYRVEIKEDLPPGSLVMKVPAQEPPVFGGKVTASDQDGPSNSLLRYSIVSGDPLQQFSIHPRSGEISVAAALDREEVPHYSLTVQAADGGDPPLSSAILVTITVADVNDNPPIFSRVNHSLLLQEGEPVGSSVLQLVVTDRDTPRNGPPFSFHIVSGNQERRFHVDQGGLLSLSAPLRKKVKGHHQLKIQVTGGALGFRFACGSAAPRSLMISSGPVSDGQWHRVLLEVNASALRLTLDQRPSASAALAQPCRMLPSQGALMFASSPTPEDAQLLPGFIGCLRGLALNSQPIRAGDAGEWAGPGKRQVFGVYRCCSSAGACDSSPCQNGGACEEDASGGLRCRCAGLFHGARCELPNNPCASQPCAHGHVCVPKARGYMCNCSLDDAQARYFQTSQKANNQEAGPIEMSSLVGPINDLDSTPFRSLRPQSPGVSFPKTQGPVVCSVAPNLPVRPPSSSDNDSIRKNHWDLDYEGLLARLMHMGEKQAKNDHLPGLKQGSE
ncbi:unnamed protein product, partial [Tetraodon nigroviridis]